MLAVLVHSEHRLYDFSSRKQVFCLTKSVTAEQSKSQSDLFARYEESFIVKSSQSWTKSHPLASLLSRG